VWWEKPHNKQVRPVYGGVYKLVALRKKRTKPRIKISESPEKVTNPVLKICGGFMINRQHGFATISRLRDEAIDENSTLVIFDPTAIWKRKRLTI
jgi:nicotinate phosphoribosyltransferase